MSPDEDAAAVAREKAIARAARIGLPAATVAGCVAAGAIQGPAAGILVLAAGALVGVIATFWGSIRTLVGETPLEAADAYALGAPRADEEQKRAVIRALKDLEFERGVGKISEEDFAELTAKYRAEAKRLLRSIDAEALPHRQEVEALVERRLRREGLLDGASDGDLPKVSRRADNGEAAATNSTPASSRKKRKREKRAAAAKAETTCAACGTKNDPDAVFCKKCGEKCGKSGKEPGAPGDAEQEETAGVEPGGDT